MKSLLFLLVITLVISSCRNSSSTTNQPVYLDSDSLIVKIDDLNNTKVQIEGTIVHICGVDGKKIKLQTNQGKVIGVISQSDNLIFSKSYFQQQVRVTGIAKETRLNKTYIDTQEKQKTLLCHIDKTPCKDSAWVNRKKQAGIADSLSNIDIARLKAKMQEEQKNYISVVTIDAEEVEIIHHD